MNAKPKRRWYQFSLGTLLTLMTLLCLGLAAWLNHRAFCLSQAERFQPFSDRLGGIIIAYEPQEVWEQRLELEESQRRTAAAYRHAIWYPWERLWIDNPPPPLWPMRTFHEIPHPRPAFLCEPQNEGRQLPGIAASRYSFVTCQHF